MSALPAFSFDISSKLECLYKNISVLVIDDSSVDRAIIKRHLNNFGFKNIFQAVDGDTGLKLFEENNFDIILVDLYLPDIDGKEIAYQIKELTGRKFIPVIFVTSETESKALEDCLGSGGDDFIVKPIRQKLLKAKIESLLRIKVMHDSVLKEKDEIAAYYYEQSKDMQDADSIIYSIHKDIFYNPGNMQWAFLAQKILSGDMICSASGPSGNHVIMLGDNTGHGLSAAIGSLLSYEIFYTMVNKGFEISAIVEEINCKLYNLLPVDRFLAACLIEIDVDYHVMKVWNAGMPDVWVTHSDGALKHKLTSINLPLGIKQLKEVDIVPARVNLDDGDLIYCCTDGAIECTNEQNELFGEQRLLNLFLNELEPKEKFKNIISEIKKFRGYKELNDDIAVLQIDCDSSMRTKKVKPDNYFDQLEPANWNLKLELDANIMRRTNPVPIMLQVISDIQGLDNHHAKLFLILTEMYSNALEHGLLKLDSRLKSEENGFAKYYEQRQSFLSTLNDAKITIDIKHSREEEKGIVQMTIDHNGDGFDHNAIESNLDNNSNEFGRGVAIVSSLCRNYEYSDDGRKLQVEYEWHYSEMENSET